MDFFAMDVTALRAASFASAWAPTDCEMQAFEERDDLVQDEDVPSFVCECRMDDGSVRGVAFPSKKQLMQHVRSTKNGTHGIRNLAAVMTGSNQCPICLSTFASRESGGTARRAKWSLLSHSQCA